jgi:hypothetical protein
VQIPWHLRRKLLAAKAARKNFTKQELQMFLQHQSINSI